MKKFLIKISYTVLPVWLFLVSMAVYLMVTGDNTGDLMRLALIKGGPEYRDSICLNLLPRVYYESVDNDSVLRGSTRDVLVIGDSFSHGGGVGKEGDYVNYLAHDSERHVTVYTTQDPTLSSPMQIAYDLLKLGGVDSTCIKNLVVQEVERYLVGRHIEFTTQHTSISTCSSSPSVNAGSPPRRSRPALAACQGFPVLPLVWFQSHLEGATVAARLWRRSARWALFLQ